MNLRVRLALTVMTAVLIALCWFTWWIAGALRPAYAQSLEESLVDSAEILAALVAAESTGDDPAIRSLAAAWTDADRHPLAARIHDQLKNDLALGVAVTDRRGRLLYDSHHPDQVGSDRSRWNDVLRTLRGGYGARATRADPTDPRTAVLHVAAPIRRAGVLIGVLTVSKPVAAVTPFVRAHRNSLILTAITICVVTAAVAALATAWITAPLARLTAHVRAVAHGGREPLPDLGRGEIAELGGVISDLRERLEGRRYAEEYVQALTHELKSPLAGLRAAAELLGEDLPVADRERFLANLRSESQRLTTLVEHLLDLAGLERCSALGSIEEVDLVTLANSVIAAANAKAIALGLTISTPSGTALLRADPFLIKQAITNLLDNALDFAPGGSVVAIAVIAQESQWRVSVTDGGPGVPDFAQAKIFERFYSLPRPETGRKGSGLGLAFVREIARLHGGACGLAAAQPTGTTAWLTLPAP